MKVKIKAQHCFQGPPEVRGGIRRYIDSLLQSEHELCSSTLISNLDGIDQSEFDLLHVHQQPLLWQVNGECPIVFTLHNHSPYCPSGTRYLASSQQPCDRLLSISGCTWGHLIDGCGSRKPQKIVKGFINTFRDKEIILKHQISVIAISQYVKNQLIELGIPQTQIFLLHHGIPTPNIEFTPISPDTHRQQRILYVGRVVPYKGLDWLLKALAHVNPQIHLDIAGSGWAQSDMKKLAKQLGVDKRITWHGWCNQTQLDTLYEQCIALILPSIWHEPAGLVSLEGYARYRPVIASASGGISDYVLNNKTGILVPPNDVSRLAQAISYLSERYCLCKKMGLEGYELTLSKFSLQNHMHNLHFIYEESRRKFHNKQTLK